jgi:hypothetical protein
MTSKSAAVTLVKGAGRLVPALLTSTSNGASDRMISDGFKIGHVDTAGIGELAAGANGLRGSLDFLLISGDERDRT